MSIPSTALKTCSAIFFIVIFCFSVVPKLVYRPTLDIHGAMLRHTELIGGDKPADRLVVVLHGWGGSQAHVKGVIDTALEKLQPAHILAPEYPASLLSNEDPIKIVGLLMKEIEQKVSAAKYKSIVLVGVSAGAPMIRKAYFCASEGCPEAGLGPNPGWTKKVERIVLLAGMNRGWATHCEEIVNQGYFKDAIGEEPDCRASKMKPSRWLGMWLGERLAPTFGVGRFILSFRRGEPFIADLRLQWLRLVRDKTKATSKLEACQTNQVPQVIQILGDTDDLVSSYDNLDIFAAKGFKYIHVENTRHEDVAHFDEPLNGAKRKEAFERALTISCSDEGDRPEQLKNRPPEEPRVRHLVFILHGIRDQGDSWYKPLEDALAKQDPDIKIWAKSYGRFPALYFLQGFKNESNIRWFMDQYTQQIALCPNLENVSFIGHSNGTYILANTLKQYKEPTFENIVFAGSVVSRKFPWDEYKKQKRYVSARNYRASNDYIVALLPGFFERLGGFPIDAGSAGHNGFFDENAIFDSANSKPPVFIYGDHGAALNSDNFPAIAKFIAGRSKCHEATKDCILEMIPETLQRNEQEQYALWGYRLNWLVWSAVLFGLWFVVSVLAAFGPFGDFLAGTFINALLVFLRYY